MDITQEDMDRLEEIMHLPTQTIAEALHWWNMEAPENLKRFVAVTTYYEILMAAVDSADNALVEWQGE